MPMYGLCTVLHMPGALTRAAAQADVTKQYVSHGAAPDVQACLVTSVCKDMMGDRSIILFSAGASAQGGHDSQEAEGEGADGGWCRPHDLLQRGVQEPGHCARLLQGALQL